MFCIVLFDTFKKVRVKRKNRIQTAIGQSNSSIILGFSTFIFFFFCAVGFSSLTFFIRGAQLQQRLQRLCLSLFVYEVLVELLLFFFFVGEQTA